MFAFDSLENIFSGGSKENIGKKRYNITDTRRPFLSEKFLSEKEPQKPQNLMEKLRESPASDAAIFKNADFS